MERAALDSARLLAALKELSCLRDHQGVMDVVRRYARELTDADGVTFVLREGDLVHYAAENAIAPLWKGRRFPISCCISGWAMLNRRSVAIEDIFADPRVPHDAYRETFVKSLAMVPIRVADPLGAIGAYWAVRHVPTRRELELLEALAGATAAAMSNAELYREARDAVRVRDEFLRIASHELRTPLTPLRLHVDMLARALRAPQANGHESIAGDAAVHERALRSVERIDAGTRRITQLVDSLLDVSRLVQGRLSLQLEEVDLLPLVRAAIDDLGPELQASGSPLELELPAGPVVGTWDPERMGQVLTHVLANATKFGEGRPIGVRVHVAGGRVHVTVRDHGAGISELDQARIFEPFERAVSARHHSGFGLGLWIVRQIAEAHGGFVQVRSAPGDGATFEIVLPLQAGR